MKPSHYNTPRTLADCTFVYGYASIKPMAERRHRAKEIAIVVATVAMFAAIGVMLAWRG